MEDVSSSLGLFSTGNTESFLNASIVRRHLMELHYHTDPEVKAAANKWFVAFQKHPYSWETSKALLFCHDEPLLQFVGAQTLAWKAKYNTTQLSIEELEQFMLYLYSTIRSCICTTNGVLMTTATKGQGATSSNATSSSSADGNGSASFVFALIERLTEAVAYCMVHIYPTYRCIAMEELLQLGRWVPQEKTAEKAGDTAWICIAFAWACAHVLSTLPSALKTLDVPSGGPNHYKQSLPTEACRNALPAVESFVSEALMMCYEAIASSTTTASSRVLEACLNDCFSLLSAWMDFFGVCVFDSYNLALVLAESITTQAHTMHVIEFCRTSFRHLSTYMGIWRCSNAEAADERQALLLKAWLQPVIPLNEGEGLFIKAVLLQFTKIHEHLQTIEKGQGANSLWDLRTFDDANFSLIIGWTDVFMALLEGFPQIFLNSETGFCKDLFLLLCALHPSTSQLCFSYWSFIKDLQREDLLPDHFLSHLLQTLSTPCINGLLKNCRRDHKYWLESDYEDTMGRESFLTEAVDSLCDIALLHSLGDGHMCSQFQLQWAQLFLHAIEAVDTPLIEICLIATGKLIEAWNGIPSLFYVLFTNFCNIPLEVHCTKAAAECLKQTAPYICKPCVSPSSTASVSFDKTEHSVNKFTYNLWLVCVNTMINHMQCAPMCASEGLLALCCEANKKYEEWMQADEAQAWQFLENLIVFVDSHASRYALSVDIALHTSLVHLLLNVPPPQIQSVFQRSLQPTAVAFKALTKDVESRTRDGLVVEAKQSAYGLFNRLSCCLEAIEKHFNASLSTHDAPKALAPCDSLSPLQEYLADTSDTALWPWVLQMAHHIALHCSFLPNRHQLPLSLRTLIKLDAQSKGVMGVHVEEAGVASIMLRCLRRYLVLLGCSTKASPLWKALLTMCASVLNHSKATMHNTRDYIAHTSKGCVLILIPFICRFSQTNTIHEDTNAFVSAHLSDLFSQILSFYQEALPHLPLDYLGLLYPIIEWMECMDCLKNPTIAHLNTFKGIVYVSKPSDFDTSLQLCIYLLRSNDTFLIKKVLNVLTHLYASAYSAEDAYNTSATRNFDSLVVALLSYMYVWGAVAIVPFSKLVQWLCDKYLRAFLTVCDSFLRQPNALQAKRHVSRDAYSIENQQTTVFLEVNEQQRVLILACFQHLKGRRSYQFLRDFCFLMEGVQNIHDFLIPYESLLREIHGEY